MAVAPALLKINPGAAGNGGLMARTLTLDEWALDEFTAPVPSKPTLLKYAKSGMISPHPLKLGAAGALKLQRALLV